MSTVGQYIVSFQSPAIRTASLGAALFCIGSLVMLIVGAVCVANYDNERLQLYSSPAWDSSVPVGTAPGFMIAAVPVCGPAGWGGGVAMIVLAIFFMCCCSGGTTKAARTVPTVATVATSPPV